MSLRQAPDAIVSSEGAEAAALRECNNPAPEDLTGRFRTRYLAPGTVSAFGFGKRPSRPFLHGSGEPTCSGGVALIGATVSTPGWARSEAMKASSSS